MSEHLYFEDFPAGATREFCRYELTREQIGSYAADFDPLLGARKTEGGGLAASPWQLPALLMRLNYDGWMNEAAARGAPGVDEAHWLRPLTTETLSARYTVRSARVSRSKPHLGLVQFFYELLGGDGEPVFSQLNSVMMALRSPQRQPEAAAPGEAAARNSDAGARIDESAAIALGAMEFPADKVIAFAHTYDPQPFHVDAVAAQTGPFGALAASGWHTASGWARAYATSVEADTPGLPTPKRLLWLKPLVWRKPVFAGNRIAFEVVPGGVAKSADGDTVMTAIGRGRDTSGAAIFEFKLGMTTLR